MMGSVGDIMTRAVVSVSPADTIATVARLLAHNRISSVPVCDAEGCLLGIVSEGDLLRPFGEARSLRREWWLDRLAEDTELTAEFLGYLHNDQRPIRDLMTTVVHSASEDTPTAKAADLMLRQHVARLPVLRGAKVIGIVSRADLVRAFLGTGRPARKPKIRIGQ